MNRNRAITLIIVLNFMIMLLHGLNYHMTNPTEINKIIASAYKTPANKAFTDQNFYNCVIINYNSENNTSLPYTTYLSKDQLASIQELSCPQQSITSTNGLELLTNGVISKEKFMKKYLHYEDAEIQEELAKIKEDNKIVQPEGLDFFGMDKQKDEEETQEKQK